MKQRFTSKQTSINSTKAPAVYSMKRAVDVMTGKTVVDIGGGRFDTAAEAARGDVVRLAATKAAALLITVYEGDGSGIGRQTAADSWQENRRTADYMDEIAAALPGWNVARFGRLIQATQKRQIFI